MTDYYFWFAQPSTILSKFDWYAGYLFATLFVVGLILMTAKRSVKHQAYRKLLRRLSIKDMTIGISGLVWFAMRYEAIPIFAKRFWAGLLFIVLVVWLLWVLKYLIFDFRKEKQEYDQNELKSKYLPKGGK